MSKNKDICHGEGEWEVICGNMHQKVDAESAINAVMLVLNIAMPIRVGAFFAVKKVDGFPVYYRSDEVLEALHLVEPFVIPGQPADASIHIRKKRKFVKPTVEEIAEYCKEHKFDVDPQYFFDKNESQGWVTGKNSLPIINWKATVRVWSKNKKKWDTDNNNKKTTDQSDFQKRLEASRRGGY